MLIKAVAMLILMAVAMIGGIVLTIASAKPYPSPVGFCGLLTLVIGGIGAIVVGLLM